MAEIEMTLPSSFKLTRTKGQMTTSDQSLCLSFLSLPRPSLAGCVLGELDEGSSLCL